jgi:Fe-Mn family superoxide dismutase
MIVGQRILQDPMAADKQNRSYIREDFEMAFTLPELGYADNALEPHIDERTMSIHRTKHHQAYVTNLNNAVTGTEWEAMSIEEICRNINAVAENIRTVVRNNGGGHANHSLFWKIMGPNAGGAPTGALADAIAAK